MERRRLRPRTPNGKSSLFGPQEGGRAGAYTTLLAGHLLVDAPKALQGGRDRPKQIRILTKNQDLGTIHAVGADAVRVLPVERAD